jgi:hypothetical protein
MPDIDGCDLARSLPQIPMFALAKIIGIMHQKTGGLALRADQSGFDAVLYKPINLSRIKTLLDRSYFHKRTKLCRFSMNCRALGQSDCLRSVRHGEFASNGSQNHGRWQKVKRPFAQRSCVFRESFSEGVRSRSGSTASRICSRSVLSAI